MEAYTLDRLNLARDIRAGKVKDIDVRIKDLKEKHGDNAFGKHFRFDRKPKDVWDQEYLEDLYDTSTCGIVTEDFMRYMYEVSAYVHKPYNKGIVRLIKDLLRDLWNLLKSLGSGDFSVIRSKWRTLCQNAARNVRNTALGKKLSSILNRNPKDANEAREQVNDIREEMNNINETVTLIESCYIYEEYQTNTSSVTQENEAETKTPYVHRVEWNWYDPNLMDLKKLPSDEESDKVTEPS